MFMRRRVKAQAKVRIVAKLMMATFSACAATACWAQADPASNYPNRPVRLIVQFAPGTTTDIIARTIGQKLTEVWGQQVIIDNRAGAGGVIATELASKAVPDGYTLAMSPSGAMAVAPSLYAKLGYDVLRDFAPITNIVTQAQVLVASLSIAAKTVKDVVELARSRPGEINYGSVGAGTVTHLAMEMLQNVAKVKFNHIPFKGSPPAHIELIGGRIQVMFDGLPASLPQIRGGKIRGIAVSSLERQKFVPELPTIAESGYPGFEATGWGGLVAPAKTPPAILDKINRDVVRIMESPETRDKFYGMGFVPAPGTRAQYAAFMRSEIEKWAKVIHEGGVKLN